MSTNKNHDTEVYPAAEQSAVEETNVTDVTGGGLIGAIGGGIIGGLAGGPVGALIGAVVGAGASAVAVDAIDHHDRDAANLIAVSNAGLASELDYAQNQIEETMAFVQPVEQTYIIDTILADERTFGQKHEDRIRARAYELWEIRGHRYDNEMQDWLDSEAESNNLQAAFSYGIASDPIIVEETIIG